MVNDIVTTTEEGLQIDLCIVQLLKGIWQGGS